MFEYIIATLVGKHKTYCLTDFIEHISKIETPPLEIVVSAIPEILSLFSQSISSIRVTGITGEDDEGRDRIIDTTSAREAIRRYIIDNDYEWSLWLDNDILVPPNITEKFISLLKKEHNLKMAHSFHPARQYGEDLRHGIGSSFIHLDLLKAYPFTFARVGDHFLGDDQIWLRVISDMSRIYGLKIISGCLFDLKHAREDGTFSTLKEKYREELL